MSGPCQGADHEQRQTQALQGQAVMGLRVGGLQVRGCRGAGGGLPGCCPGMLPMPLARLPLQAEVSSHSAIPARPECPPPPRPSGVWEGLQSWLPTPPEPTPSLDTASRPARCPG